MYANVPSEEPQCTSRKSKEGSTCSIEFDPIGLCMPIGNTKSWYLLTGRLRNQLASLAVKAHAEAHGESCALLSQFIHHLYLGKASRREASYCPLPVTLITQVQSWVCYVDVHFGDHCSSNFSPKVALVSCSCTPRLFTMTGMNLVNLTYRGCFTGHKENLCSVQ